MMQQKQAADEGSGAEDDQIYLPRVFLWLQIQFIFVNTPVYLQIEQFILIGMFECYTFSNRQPHKPRSFTQTARFFDFIFDFES